METTNQILLMFYALVILAMVVGLFVLDTAHHRSEK
jgi:phosphate starvation-inducible membrane PsiE